MGQKKRAHVYWLAVLVTTVFAGVAFIVLAALPYGWVKPTFDTLARDGSSDLFTYFFHQRTRLVLVILGLSLLLLAGCINRRKQQVEECIENLTWRSFNATLYRDIREIRASLLALAQAKIYIYILVLITLLGALTRGLYLSQPMLHDEAYTYVAFASRALRHIITDYHLPNNHVFHTILVFLSTRLLGNYPWTVRLPAYLAGVLVIPACYLAGSGQYDKKIALAAAALVSVSPVLIDYSANARGYSLLCLITLAILASAAYIKKHRNLIAWSLLIIFSCLGFYTLPTMLYPFSMVISWLLISALTKDVAPEYGKRFLIYLLFSTAIVGILTFALYAPILYVSGLSSLISNEYVQPVPYSGLWDSLLSRVASVSGQWLEGIPLYWGILALAGILLGLILHRRISTQRVPLQIAALLGIGLLLILQRVAPLARIWLFLLPLTILWASAGIIGGIRLLLPATFHRQATAVLLVGAILLPGIQLASSSSNSKNRSLGVEEEIAIFMRENLQPTDLVVIQSPLATTLEYYFARYGLDEGAFDEDRPKIQRMLVVVSRKYGQTLDEVLDKKGPQNYSQMHTLKPIHQYKHVTIYELSP